MKVATKKFDIFNRKRTWAGILLAQVLLFYLFTRVEGINNLFARFFEFQKEIHQQIFAWFPFSFGDISYIILGIALIFFFIKILKKQTRNSYLLKFLILLNLLYFTYQLLWGMLYFQKPILAQLPEGKITVQETKALSLKYLNLCKQTRKTVKQDRNGVFKAYDLSGVKAEILHHQNTLPKFISKKGTAINAFKPSLFKGIMSYTGILGYYNPFTAEAQFNAELPSSYLPFTLAHESAHQLGYAREQEANFIGYLLGRNSEHAELKYSTEYFVLKSLLNSLAEKNPAFVKEVLHLYSPEMKRDRLAEKMFIKKHEGFLDVLFGFTNDLFLKSNQQEGSVTYSYFIDLLIRYERTVQ